MKHCSITTCDKKHYGKGYCQHHWYATHHKPVKYRRPQHGMTGTRVHGSWKSMKKRCYGKTEKGYKNWGGRGITVCNRWRYSFANFYADMGLPPSPEHTLDRINNDGNYEPGNCRWADYSTQSLNRRPYVRKKSTNSTGYIGVFPQKVRFMAALNISLGTFATAEEAALAYNEAIVKIRGDKALLNVITKK